MLVPSLLLAPVLVSAIGCKKEETAEPSGPYVEQREACADHDPLKRALFGDLHVHGLFSFDAGAYDTLIRPSGAYDFARGETITLPPLDANGAGTRSLKLDRPLDFVGVTEHGDLLGEVYLCTTPGSAGYDAAACETYRSEDQNGAFDFGVLLSVGAPERHDDICGSDGSHCREAAAIRWAEMQEAAEEAYDRTSACDFTSFVAYEYTNTTDVSNLHRNVVFGTEVVPELPVTFFETPNPWDLWSELHAQCIEPDKGCDVVVLPHNSNLSNGALFTPSYPSTDEATDAAFRGQMEPVVEIFQHKGDSECRNGFDDVDAEDDPLCDFEKLRPADDEQCGDEVGAGGMRLWGCVHRLDFVRNVLKEGLIEGERIGVNPYRLGFIASTDTHNGTPGHTSAEDFAGHVGSADDTPEERLGDGNVTHDGIINNPGGLAGVWAEENSRSAIFAALHRRETFATSGPRIELRFFGGASFSEGLCEQPDWLTTASAQGVPMGGVLDTQSGSTPSFVIQANKDAGTDAHPGTDLQQLQVVKGWLDADGTPHEAVYVVAGDPDNGASVDPDTCETTGSGSETLCSVWSDPDFDAAQPAFYYARAIENPTCRWSTWQCNALTSEERPEHCDDGAVPTTVQQRAWASPIWWDGKD